jgi:large subunit ribosomal protein L21
MGNWEIEVCEDWILRSVVVLLWGIRCAAPAEALRRRVAHLYVVPGLKAGAMRPGYPPAFYNHFTINTLNFALSFRSKKISPKNPSNPLQTLTFALLIFGKMFAIVKIAGQQFKVQKDQTLYVPRVDGNAGDQVEFSDILLLDNDGKLSVGSAVKGAVKAEILGQVQGDKVIAFKMKRRKGFRKKHGHRTQYTKIKVTGIA